MDGIGAGSGRSPGVAGGVIDGDAVLDAVLVAVEAHDDREVRTAPVAHRGDDLDEESGPALERTAVRIVPAVPCRGQERGEEVAVGGVHLDPVESSLLHPCGGVGEVANDALELSGRRLGVGGHLAAGEGRHPQQLVHRRVGHHPPGVRRRRWERRNQRRPPLGDVDARRLAVVADLDDDFRTMGVDGIGEPPEVRDHAIVRERGLVAGGRPVRVRDSRCLDDQEPDATPCPGLVVGDGLVGDQALVGAVVLVHGREHDPVPEFHPPDPPGSKQVRKRVGHVRHLGGLVPLCPTRLACAPLLAAVSVVAFCTVTQAWDRQVLAY